MEEKPLVYRIYPFTAIREYVAGLMLLILGFRMFSFISSTVTDLDVALTVVFIIAILAVWRVKEVKPTSTGVLRITLLVLIMLSPLIAVQYIEFYRPPDWLIVLWRKLVEGLDQFSKTPVVFPAIVTTVFIIGGTAILYGVVITLSYKIVLTERDITIERSLPMEASYKIPIDRIVSVEAVQSSMGKRFNYGNVLVVTDGMGTIVLPKIEKPEEFKNLVVERYTKLRTGAEPINELGFTLREYPIKNVKISEGSTCPVCLNPVLTSPSNEVYISICPFCLSVFHMRCLRRWVEENGYKCPNCGRGFKPA